MKRFERIRLMFSIGVLLVLSGSFLLLPTVACLAASVSADPTWCDQDSDGFCPKPHGTDCDDSDSLTYPGAEERPDLKDNNCNGFGDEPPVGFTREGYSGQGFASAVEWYEDYVYLAAAAVLRVYHAPPGTEPTLVHEIEFRDWVREMAVDGDTLFVAARGDGLFAFDLAHNPSHPEPAGRVSGLFDAGDYTGLEAVFNGVHARNNSVAVACANDVAKGQGGVDAVVFDYDPTLDRFTPTRALSADVRANTAMEIPISVGLTEDARGLYIGYGVLVGELVYVPLDIPEAPILHGDLGAIMDIAIKGNTAFVAITGLDWPWVDVSMLSRVSIIGDELVEDPIVTHPGSSAGNAVDIDGDFLCFGTWSPARYEEGYNLWAFTDLLKDTPTRVGAAGTPDWIFQLACRDSSVGSDWIYVADEWGGLELWESDGITLTLDLDHYRIASGALSSGLWSDGSRVYSAKRGAGLWVFDESDPQHERAVVEWIDRSDPGCNCAGCCPPEEGSRPYPPAVFVSVGTSNQGRVALLGHDRNTAVAGDGYLMMFEEDENSGEYECIYSDPMGPSDPLWGIQGGNLVTAHDEILFASLATHSLRLYQHCPTEADPVRFLGEIETPSQGSGWEFADVAVYGDYLFVAEVHRPLMSEPDRGMIHVYRWTQDGLAACPDQPSLSEPLEPLGSFCKDLIPYRLLVDPARGRLIVGCTLKSTFPIKEGDLLFYNLNSFDPDAPDDMDDHRTFHTPDESIRVTFPNIYGILLDGDALYVADRDNGLYQYSLSREVYVGFYPAHRGPMSQPYSPRMVQSPDGVVPLYHSISVALTPSGRLMVQEHVSGRVSILSQQPHQIYPSQIYLPLVAVHR
jgi:hypothetical protein